ncbi:MAG: dinitrogenase iron-molybdenum cofactor biosynthesis protein [Firmicutes bacterium HGW-Firmicutes-16]|nr:MAG: dinitrogenase iron-molybdenum cofactor biosynthesis protein [Firmicutes bacterium HGW-Firmicutes-16]
MKIAIPVDDKSLESNVCPSFGRAPYFLFYNMITKESYYLDNSAIASQGGAGIKAAQVIADHGVKVLLTPRCGENAEVVLSKSEVLIYKTIPGTVQQNIDALASEELVLLSDFHKGFHGHEK